MYFHFLATLISRHHFWMGTLLSAGLFFSASSAAEDFLTQAQAEVNLATEAGSRWDGPREGPLLQPNKHIIFVASDMKNGGVQGVYQGLQEAIRVTNWQLDLFDGSGSVREQLAALNQAIAKQPDGIILAGWDPSVAKIPLAKAHQAGIELVAWQASPTPGPLTPYHIFYNVSVDAEKVARLAALQAIVHSQGQAKVVIFTDSLYQIALAKANMMRAIIEQCQGCQVLDFIDTPLADTATRIPSLTFSLLQQYREDYHYALTINDLYIDFMVPALKVAHKGENGAPYTISAGDGSVSAFERIRQQKGQLATVASPLLLHGWQLLDELNRSFAGTAPSGYIAPVYLVNSHNIKQAMSSQHIFDPNNDYRTYYQRIWHGDLGTNLR